jgi:polyhydroxyalkanoate synthesis regulator phasin
MLVLESKYHKLQFLMSTDMYKDLMVYQARRIEALQNEVNRLTQLLNQLQNEQEIK